MRLRQFKSGKIEIDYAIERVQQMRVNRGMSMKVYSKELRIKAGHLPEETVKRILKKAA